MAPTSSFAFGEVSQRSLPFQHFSENSKQILLPCTLGIHQIAFAVFQQGYLFAVSLRVGTKFLLVLQLSLGRADF